LVIAVVALGLLVATRGTLDAKPNDPPMVGAAPGATQMATAVPLPACTVGDTLASHTDPADWATTLVDTELTLGPHYVPPDLVSTAKAGIKGGQIRSLVIDDLARMVTAAKRAGHRLVIKSAYRSYERQQATFDSLVRGYSRDFALRSAGRPGHSEHQLGTAIDFAGSETWLGQNAWVFGFVLSYPEGRSPQLTCYKPEAWHFRYFGVDRAAAIHSSGLSPREWLWQQQG
jgi:zinc D-Ala-D-Ala carboxypeptidase